MNAELMLCAGLALQANLLDAVRSGMSVLAQGCSALHTGGDQRDSLHRSCVVAVAMYIISSPCALMAKHHGGIHMKVCNLATLPVCRQGATMGASSW